MWPAADEGRLAIGRTLTHYRITAALGSGGMGEVYRATDMKLGRDVALKVLPPAMAANADRLERFRREAKALAALDHPGIVTVFSVEEAEGVHFLTMQLIEGQALDRAIPEGGMPVPRVLDIASALADALAAAHDKGIVHRDLKPANVMITTDGRVKVLDFGLAKELREADPMDVTLTSSPHTEIGVVMGTPAYMSPEQVVGGAIDHRTDIFSLGVLLYEMVTGRRPFQGRSSAETTSAILRDTPAAVTEVRADVPGDLARIIRRCLEKDPRDRIQTARDVGNELRDLARQRAEPASPASPRASRAVAAPDSGAARADEGLWVAVLPFKYKGANIDVTALAEGLSEEIVTGLSRFSYLRVIARSSTARFSGEAVDVRAVGEEIGARYVMEGSLRQAGPSLRVAVQLVDAVSGAHLWAETYDRPFRPEEIFALQDDLVPRVVSTVADWAGVLPRALSEVVRSKPTEALSPYEAVLRGCGYYQRVRPDEHAVVRAALERAVEEAPHYADAWMMLSMLCGEEHRFGFNVKPDPLGRALQAARRAVDAAPSNHLAHMALAQAHYFRKELDAFRNAAERAVALNPMDGFTVEYLAHLVAFAGDWERGRELGDRARQLNPHHPAWYWALPMLDAFRRGDYLEARSLIPKALMPGQYYSLALFAAVYGQLGERGAAVEALREALVLKPDLAEIVREQFGKWYLPQLVEQLIDGLRKAGLEVPEVSSSSTSTTESQAPSSPSGATRADEGFWVAVLPFRHRGAGLEALAEGLTEDVVTGLSRFSYLRVVSRGATSRYTNAAADASAVAKEIGARYVMEGSLGHAGGQLRVAVQLVDASTGAHLWAETYTRPFEPDHIFAIQDDIVPRIVSTSADHFGVLARSISDAVREKPLDQLSPYEAVMRGFGYHFRLSPEEHAAARVALERAVERAPANADCWAMLSWVYSHEHAHGFNPRPGSLDRALAAARRAVDLAPSNHVAQQALAVALFFRRDIAGCRSAAERALALNPLDGSNEAIFLIAFTGDWDRGCRLIRWAMDQNPHHPRWYGLILAINEYRVANYRGALDEAVKANLPDGPWKTAVLAAAHGQLGDVEAARATLRTLSASEGDFARSAREILEKWLDAQLVEHVMEGLLKAGLAAPAAGFRELTPIPGFGGRPAIAVLPFDNLSGDPEQQYFADGLAEDLITRLSRWRSFPVIARNSSFVHRGKAVDVKRVGADLGARYVVEGSVRKANSRVRITAQLIDTNTAQHVWARTYDRELTNVLAVQDELSEAIAASLAGGLERAEHARARSRPSDNPAAWDFYQRALPLAQSFTREGSVEARALLERAIALDPQFSAAFARLASVGVWEVLYSWTDDPDRTLAAAITQARRAAALDPDDAEARVYLSVALMTAGDGHGALEEARRAAELNPSMPLALAMLAYHQHIAGHPPVESIELVQRALRLSPHDPVEWLFYDVLSGACFNAGRFNEGLAAGQRLIALSPTYYWGYLWSAMNAVGLVQLDSAREFVRAARAVKPDVSLALAQKCLGTMDPDVDRRFTAALRAAGLD